MSSDQRIHIGGELWITTLQSDAFVQAPVHRFDDWPDHSNAMKNYHQNN